MACSTDFDCPGTLVCYTSELSWYADIVGTDSNSTCACASWYGWTGDTCEDFSSLTYMYVALQLLVSCIAYGWAFVGVRVLYRIFTVHREGKFLNSSNITAIYSTTALVMVGTWRIIIASAFLRPSHYTLELEDDPEKYTDLTPGDRAFTTLTATFTTLCALNVSLMWLQVASSSKRFRRQAAYLTFYRKIIIAFEIIFTLVILALMASNMVELATLAAFPFIIFVVITFIAGQTKMNSLLHSMTTGNASSRQQQSSPSDEGSDADEGSKNASKTAGNALSNGNSRFYRRMMQLIRNTSRMVIFWGLVTLAAGALFVVTAMDWKEYAPIGKLSVPTLANEIFCMGILGVAASIQWYVWRVIRAKARRIRKHKTATASKDDGANDNSYTNTGSFKVPTNQPITAYQPKSEATVNYERFKEGAASFHADFDEEEEVYDHTYDPNDDYV